MERIKCVVCGKEFEPRQKNQKVCSDKCSNTYYYSNVFRRANGLPERKKYKNKSKINGSNINGNQLQRENLAIRIEQKLKKLRAIKRYFENKNWEL